MLRCTLCWPTASSWIVHVKSTYTALLVAFQALLIACLPPLLPLQRLKELSPPEALAAVVKFGTRTAIDLAGRL